MSEENVENIRQAVEAFNRRDADAFVALASPNVEWEDPIFWSGVARTYRGREEVREWFNRSWNLGRASMWRSRRSPKLRMTGRSSASFSPHAARAAAWRHLDFASGRSTGSRTARPQGVRCSAKGQRPSK